MFNVAELPCRSHFDVRFSLIADLGNLLSVRSVSGADLRYSSEEETQKYVDLLGNNYDI